MTEFELRCARPERLADCVHDELALLVACRPAVILYGALGGIYLEDVADDPDRTDEWDVGDEAWLNRARSAYRILTTRSGGCPVRLTRLQRGWIAAPEPEIPRDMLAALASFGTDPVLWTVLSEPRRFTTDLDLATALDHAPCWLAHGYKEPFLAIGTGEPIESIARVLGVAVDPSAFRPHRVRAHAQGAR